MTDEALRAELLQMRQDDLDLRAELIEEGTLFDGYAERMVELHRRHNARLRTLMAAHGWPGRSLAGEDGAEAAWLVLQHAILDPELMRGALLRVEQSVQHGETEPVRLACLVDRIRSLEGRPQVYGTQHDWDASGALSPLPIENIDQVDERRRQVGLGSLADNTRRLRARAAAEGDKPPGDPVERQRRADEWACSVGWRTSTP